MDLEPPKQVRPLRLLFAALDVPFPVTSGRRLRNWALLQSLAEQGHEVTIVYFEDSESADKDRSELKRVCRNIDAVPQPRRSDVSRSAIWRRLQALAAALPYGAWRLRSREFHARLQAWLAREPFDALICDDAYVAANIPSGHGLPIILNKHGIGTVVLERFLVVERNPAKKVYGYLELWKTRRWEARVCDQATLIMACSEDDRTEIDRLSPGSTVVIVPNVIDVRNYEPTPSVSNHTVVFVAYMGWYPNQDAVEFFVSQVLPHLQALIPDVKFVAAGRNPPESMRNLGQVPGVVITGSLPDIRPVIAEAALCVVPLRIGTGTRLKILEAAAMGKAIVSTRVGAEGLEFTDGSEIVLADEPQHFAREVASLLNSPERAQALGAAARRLTEEQYSMKALRGALARTVAIIEEKIANKDRLNSNR
jgi:polysaccharide biosynthesis protein PslH